jgi:hypothetical protein
MPLICSALNDNYRRASGLPAPKDQAGIAQSLADGKDIQEIHGQGEATLFDAYEIPISNMIFGKLHGAILKLCQAFGEHAHAAGALYQISRDAEPTMNQTIAS